MDHKQKKISDIKNEVKELHPLLRSIFNGMKEIINVEYKQGPLEKGTDFVLTKRDDILGDVEYIGIVAKITPINQSDREVDRQIEECKILPRVVCTTKKVYVTQIWVISTKNISLNAQEVFSEKYKSSSLKFIDGEKLIKLIDAWYPEYWNDVPISIGRHLISLKEKMETIEKNSLSFPYSGTDNQILQELIKIDNDEYEKEKPRANQRRPRTELLKVCQKLGISFIEGPMGSGKSYLLRRTAIYFSDIESYNQQKIIPIYTTLKDIDHNHSGSIEKLITENLENHPLADDVKILILCDGIDEFKCGNQNRLELVKSICEQTTHHGKIKLVMAGRDINVLSKGIQTFRSVSRYQISPLSLKQVLGLIEKTCTQLNIKNRIANDLQRSALVKVLPKTPIAAVLLTKLLQENSQEIPSNITELYSKYTELSLGRWDYLKGLQSEKEYEAARKIMINIAEYLLDNELFCISSEEALGFFTSYLGQRNTGIEPQQLFDTIVNRSDIISHDEKHKIFSFKHRSFTEFFYACGRVSKQNHQASESDFDLYWGTVTFFWAGLLKDCPDLIDRFSALEMHTDRTHILKIINMGNILLAADQTPYSHISAAINNIFIEAAQYLKKVKNLEQESVLSKFTEMHLLCIFRYLLSENYGYEFFKNAIYEAMISIEDDTLIDSETKAYALFFLNTCSLSFSEREDIFEGMIEKIGKDKLPLNIQLAIKHEADHLRSTNNSMISIFRNIRKLVKDRSFKSLMETMYEKPLSLIKKGKDPLKK